MAYVNCHSYITGLDVQYPVIQVKLKHKVRDLDFGCSNANNSTAFWNTSPAYMATERFYYDENNHRWQTNGSYTKSTAGVTNRMTQRYDASGTLKATYDYIYRGTHPVISNKDFDVDDYEVGENIVDLFSTDMVMVKAYLYKLKLSEIYYNGNTPPSYTFYDVDNNAVSEPYVFAAVQIAMFLKSTGEEIGRYSFLQSDSVNGMLAPTRFAFSTELFDIEGFNVNYLSYFSYYSNYNMFFTDSEKSSMKLYNGEEDVTGTVDHCVVPQFTLYASQGYTASRNSYAFYKFETIDNQGNSLSNTEVKNVAANAVWQYILDCFDNSDEFIDFNTQLTYYYRWYTSSQIQSKIDQYFATDRGYKVKSNGQTISAFTALSNCIVSASPVLISITDANHAVTNYWNKLATYIPLTTDVQGGDPDPGPGPGPDPGPEETEEADDPDTDYTPDQSDGEESYTYHSSDLITGNLGSLPYQSSYNNYVFGHFKISNINPGSQYDRYAAYNLIMDCINTTLLESVATLFKANKINLSEIISRVYETPFSYEDIITSSQLIKSAAPALGYFGPITQGVVKNGKDYEWDNNTHYYNLSLIRFVEMDFGTQTIQKVFNNYLDFACGYILNLPYGGGQVEIDPSFLFNNESDTGLIRLTGIFDMDSGTLTFRVNVGQTVNNLQLYYQTTINIASDKVVSASDAAYASNQLAKLAGSLFIGLTAMQKGSLKGQAEAELSQGIGPGGYITHNERAALGRARELLEGVNYGFGLQMQRHQERREAEQTRYENDMNVASMMLAKVNADMGAAYAPVLASARNQAKASNAYMSAYNRQKGSIAAQEGSELVMQRLANQTKNAESKHLSSLAYAAREGRIIKEKSEAGGENK